ncbi:MAG TPA: hypothetical protein VJC07_05580, partial [Candidatus Nanoarchaeia archaeon]|nr:hypothetical protein [Candidatus Nanoarchaeia archaeon]
AVVHPIDAPQPSFLTKEFLGSVWRKYYATNPRAFNASRWDYLGSDMNTDGLHVHLAHSTYCHTQALIKAINRRLGDLDISHLSPEVQRALSPENHEAMLREVFSFGLNSNVVLVADFDDPKHGVILPIGKRSAQVAQAPNSFMLIGGGVMASHYSEADMKNNPDGTSSFDISISARRQLVDELGTSGVELLNIGSMRDHEEGPDSNEVYAPGRPIPLFSIDVLIASQCKARDRFEHDGLRFISGGTQQLYDFMAGNLETDVLGQKMSDYPTLGVCLAGLLLYGQQRHGTAWRDDAETALRKRGFDVIKGDIKRWQ